MFHNATPILIVDAIEPCLPFWKALGFHVTTTVPNGPRLGFAMLQGGNVVLMYQTISSVADDLKGVTVMPGGITYIDVDDLVAISTALPAESVAIPQRTTFYGSHEIFAWEPGGNLIGFAQHSDEV